MFENPFLKQYLSGKISPLGSKYRQQIATANIFCVKHIFARQLKAMSSFNMLGTATPPLYKHFF